MEFLMAKPSSDEKLQKLNKVSGSFCLAKWLQVTVDLVNGTTHSCHHPERHLVPLDELKKSPGALHNTEYKKKQRKMMLKGVRPPECSYCWDMEDLGNTYSDRFIKSTDPWAWDDLDRIAGMPWDQNVSPRYLEVMLDKTCNFSCAYCAADVSSSIAAEMKKFGPYPVITNPIHRMPRPEWAGRDKQIFVEAFEKWLPEILNDLKVLRITGGEPLLSQSFWKLLTTLKSFGTPGLEFAVNSHLNHREDMIERFCREIRELLDSKKIKTFDLYFSLDTSGAQAEYIRHGLDYNQVCSNLEKICSLVPETKPVIMCTFNILSIGTFGRFIDDVMALKKKFPVGLDISCLKNPEYLRADLADGFLREILNRSFLKMQAADVFSRHELSKMENLVNWVESKSEQNMLARRRADFYNFINEYDMRKGKKFLEIFPEYKSFYNNCRGVAILIQGELLR